MRRAGACTGLLLTAAIAAASSVAEIPTKMSDRPVHARALEIALAGNPIELAAALRADGIPVGVILREPTRDRLRLARFAERPGWSSTARLGEIVETFERSQVEWSVVLDEYGVVFSERGVRRFDRYDGLAVDGEPLEAAFLAVQRLVDPSLPREAAELPSGPPIRLRVGLASLPRILNAVAAEAPGTSWLLVRHTAPTGEFDRLSIELAGGRQVDFSHRLPLPASRYPRPSAGAISVGFSAGVASASQPGVSKPPRRLAEAAIAGTPLELLDGLRNRGIPVGLVVTASTWSSIRDRSTGEPADAPGGTVEEALELFLRSHPAWEVGQGEYGVVLREEAVSPRTERFESFRIDDEALRHAFAHAQAMIDPLIPTDQGLVFSGPSSVHGPDPPQLSDLAGERRVSVAARSASFEELLNVVAAADPGTGWVLVREPDRLPPYDTLHVRYSDGFVSDQRFELPIAPALTPP